MNLEQLTPSQLKEVEKFVERLLSGGGDFETFWKAYPRRKKTGKAACIKKWNTKRPDPEKVMKAIEVMKKEIEKEGTEQRFIAQPLTWLNQERYDDEIEEVDWSNYEEAVRVVKQDPSLLTEFRDNNNRGYNKYKITQDMNGL